LIRGAGRATALAFVLGVVLMTTPPPAGAVGSDDAAAPAVACRFSDPRLVEISGITWSRLHPGVSWVHNDSGGGPYLYAVDDTTCRTLARVRVAGIGARDLEAIATGVDPAGRPVLWVGDIGDNRDSWPSVRLIAVPEPATLRDQEVRGTTYRFTYADGPHNAESILADPARPRVWVVTKQFARGGVWSVPLSTTRITAATRVAEVGGLVTDAAMSPDGSQYVIRDYLAAAAYAAPPSAASIAAPTRFALPAQVQGEAISYTRDGTALLVASERETALWRVPLPSGSATPAASDSPPSPPSPTSSSGGPPVLADDAAESTTEPATWILAVALAGLGVVGAAFAARRLRR
jgi:hypothetical protein